MFNHPLPPTPVAHRPRKRASAFRTAVASLLTTVLTTGALLSSPPEAAAQTPQWLFDGQIVDFRATTPGGPATPITTPTTASLTSSTRDFTAPYHHAAYDTNGNLLFYLDGRDFKKADGTIFFPGMPYMWNFDVEIIPRPGFCSQYYIVFGVNQNAQGRTVDIKYLTVDVSNWTLSNPTTLITSNPQGTYVTYYFSMATSGLRSDATRRLYVVGTNQVLGFVVAAGGITSINGSYSILPYVGVAGITPVPGNGLLGETTDAEVAADGSALAYSLRGDQTTNDAKIVYLRLNNDGALAATPIGSPLPYPAISAVVSVDGGTANGVTFDPASSSIVLFTAGKDNLVGSGVFSAKITNATTPIISTGNASTRPFAQSDINCALDGRIYASSTTSLRPVNFPATATNGGTVSMGNFALSVTPTVGSFGLSSGTPSVRLFPTQINGRISSTGLAAYSAYVPVFAPATVNLASGSRTITVETPFVTGRTYAWTLSGAPSASITSGQGTSSITISIPQASAPATLTVSLATNAACSLTRTRTIGLVNAPGCTICGRPGPSKPPTAPPSTSAYPNPAADRLFITGGTTDEATLVSALTGQRTRIRLTNGAAETSVAHLPNGLYWLETTTGKAVQRERLVVQH